MTAYWLWYHWCLQQHMFFVHIMHVFVLVIDNIKLSLCEPLLWKVASLFACYFQTCLQGWFAWRLPNIFWSIIQVSYTCDEFFHVLFPVKSFLRRRHRIILLLLSCLLPGKSEDHRGNSSDNHVIYVAIHYPCALIASEKTNSVCNVLHKGTSYLINLTYLNKNSEIDFISLLWWSCIDYILF